MHGWVALRHCQKLAGRGLNQYAHLLHAELQSQTDSTRNVHAWSVTDTNVVTSRTVRACAYLIFLNNCHCCTETATNGESTCMHVFLSVLLGRLWLAAWQLRLQCTRAKTQLVRDRNRRSAGRCQITGPRSGLNTCT